MKSLLSNRVIAVVLMAGFFALSCSDGPVLQYDIPGSDNGSDVAGDTIPPKDILPDNQEDRIGEDVGIDLIGVDTNTPDATGDTGPLPREFNYPCLDNTDCNSGYCVESVNGLVCSRRCNNDCPDDWYCRTVIVVGDPVTLCMPSGVFLCRSCIKNSQCADGLCLPYEEGSFCSRSCSEFSSCPDGYDCVESTDPETSRKSKQCIPSNGTCTCRQKNDLEERPCSRDSEAGTCLGFQTCNVETGWSECSAAVPSAEVCDGLDNDCNRISDDNPELPLGDCFNTVDGIGSCRGEWLCRGEDGWDCFGPMPAAETCNYLDDDCDGDTDEEFKVAGKYVGQENCGQCGVGCDGLIPFAKTTSCDPGVNPDDIPQCVVDECIQGYLKAGPQLCRPAISSLCVPCEQDSNCGSEVNKCIQFESGKYCGRDCSQDGIYGPECPGGYQCLDVAGSMQCVPISGTCECTQANHGIKRICEVVNEFGTCQGNEVCDGAVGWVNCSARVPADEICDAIDNDCNGLVDDDPVQPPDPCEKSWTDPLSGTEYTCGGTWSCQDTPNGKEWVCPARTPSAEVCNAIDDNCDGQTDEDFKLAGTNKYNNYDHCGACNVSCAGLVQNAVMKCDATPPQPVCLVDYCNEGWWKASDLSCQRFPESQCLACSSDASCQIPGDVCIPADSVGNTYCMWDCSDDALRPELDPERKTCPEGYYCRETNELGQPLFKCFPQSNSCDCLAANAGQVRACVISNPFGRCFGDQTCQPATGWTACNAQTPSVEICNYNDDDCNGLIDEPFPSVGSTCTAGVGECLGTGSIVCNAIGDGVECTAVAGEPVSEICDLKDNDCDSSVDEDFPDYGKVCFVGTGECLASGTYVCQAGGLGVECNAVQGIPVDETCDDRDNDCDGSVDEDYLLKGRVCAVGVGECFANGVWTCTDDQTGLECDAIEGIASQELCDGLDNDCDLEIDELWPERETVCVVGQGACRATGVYRCMADMSGIECSVVAGTPSVEVCDGIDNDCDGSIDEDWTDLGRACQEGVGECLDAGVYVCNVAQTGIECDAEPGLPVVEQCDGLDNDCDGSIDEDWTNKGRPCQSGVGECLSNGVYVCSGDMTGIECNAVEGSPVAELCDGLDNDCDGSIDENWSDKGKACEAGVGACQANGVYVCSTDQSNVECNAVVGSPTAEQCDNIDNDCDGDTDETWLNKGTACQAGIGECVASGVYVCTVDKTDVHCNATPGTPVAELCDGLDNDCDSQTDEDYPTKGQVCSAGVGQCQATGTWQCTVAQTGVQCSATQGEPSAETCDYLDNDCDGDTDETFKSGVYYVMDEACGNCFTDCTQIYDLPNAYGECDSSGVPKCKMLCDAGWYDLNEIPDDGCEFFLDETAVYVSHNDPMAADNAGCGLAPSVLGIGQYPCMTIQYGITRAGLLGRSNVLVSNGEYAEAVTVAAGINMKGGYRADTWERDVETTLTTIRGPSSGAGHLMSVTAQNISTSTLFEGFLVHGPANFNSGGNSYGLYIVNCTSALVVRDNIIYGGFGGAGSNGSSGTDGLDGVNGNAGQDTIETNQYQLSQCNNLSTTPGNQGTYGDGGARTCGSNDDVGGGEGAGASCPDGNDQQSNGAAGQPAVSGGSGGTGGAGGYDRYTTNCGMFSAGGQSATGMNGTNGGDGTNGAAGAGCPPASNVGTVTGSHWVGTSGGNGGNGTPGGGGGGGGAGGGADVDENCTGTDDCLGGSGGGGGSGACGGVAASGGSAGGGAFAVFISFTSGSSNYPVLDSNIIVRGQGGRGGNGGLGGAGGIGGDGANGGNVLGHWAFAMGQGGRGGQGGDGGHGGGGGGGCGGASVGVFVFNGQGTQPSYATQNTVTGSASGGQGGAGGPSLGSSGTAGSDGYAANVHFN